MSPRKKTPDFFDDPVNMATGPELTEEKNQSDKEEKKKRTIEEPEKSESKKVGYYISENVVGRIDKIFYELKLAGVTLKSKSALVEAALLFSLDDLEKGEKSRILKNLLSRL